MLPIAAKRGEAAHANCMRRHAAKTRHLAVPSLGRSDVGSTQTADIQYARISAWVISQVQQIPIVTIKGAMHCLLVGNGFNRLSMQLSWQQLLSKLTTELGLGGQVAYHEQKPLSLLFEELCVRVPNFKTVRAAEHEVKKRIASLMESFPPHELLYPLVVQFDSILTTNYDVSIEESLAGPLYYHQSTIPESRYSLFRKNDVGARQVWHIHGEASRPQSILLGYDQYAGYLQKIRNYVTNGLLPAESKSAQLIASARRLDENCENQGERQIFSWVDLFLRDHLHIVGLGFDFTEIDLWWLLVYKRRRDTKTGRTFFYCIDIDRDIYEREAAKMSLFSSLGVEIVAVQADSYAGGYESIIRAVNENIASNCHWLERDKTERSELNVSSFSFNPVARPPERQRNLPFKSKK
ncbi:SIR2 family protein [Paraburkholderia fungorum]|nr:SIR2 family protein [Paraburkholderia fungorum]